MSRPGRILSRTLRSPKEKLATLLTAPFMVCGTKVPVFILLAAAFFPQHGARVMFLITLAGWAAALVVAKILRSSVIRGPSTPFVMELPPYRLPTALGLILHTWERGWQYIKKAYIIAIGNQIAVEGKCRLRYLYIPDCKLTQLQSGMPEIHRYRHSAPQKP